MALSLVCAAAIAVALIVDRVCGEPPAWLHPVVGMGRYLAALGQPLLRWQPAAAFGGGVLAWIVGAAGVTGLAFLLEQSILSLPAVPAALLLGLLLKPLFAWRVLRDEVAAVDAALAHSIDAGRTRVARLVSRDVTALDATQVREAAISTLAENLNDSVVAPLFWFALFGLPGAALYRFANTADAMWGYRGAWEWAGKWAAWADDALSWLPARLTAGMLVVVAGGGVSWRVLRAEARRTPSPNGGWPMGAMACLLGVALRKPGVYALNATGRAATAADLRRALRWSGRAVGVAGLMAIAMTLVSLSRISGRGEPTTPSPASAGEGWGEGNGRCRAVS